MYLLYHNIMGVLFIKMLWTSLHMSLMQICIHFFLTYILRSGVAGLWGMHMFSFSWFTVFWSGCTYLYSHQQCMIIPVVLHPHWFLVLSFKKVSSSICYLRSAQTSLLFRHIKGKEWKKNPQAYTNSKEAGEAS